MSFVRVVGLAALLVAPALNADAWVMQVLDVRGHGAALSVDPSGNVFAAGQLYGTSATGSHFTVLKLDPAAETVLWQQRLDGTVAVEPDYAPRDSAMSVAADPAGDAIAAGTLFDLGNHVDAAVVKLAGATGAVVWQTTFADAGPAAAALEPGGDAVGIVRSGHFSAFRVAGATGAPLWRQDVFGTTTSAGGAFALDVASDVVVAGDVNSTPFYSDFAVVKLSLATGAELWRYVVSHPAPDFARAVAQDDGGDVIAGGILDRNFTVVKLSGATGAELWRFVLPGSPGGEGAEVVVPSPDGDVFVGGQLLDKWAVLRLSGTTGAELWRRVYRHGNVQDLTLDPTGDVVAAGYRQSRFTVMRLSGDSGKRRWSRTLTTNPRQFSGAFGVVLDGDANPIAVGQARAKMTSGVKDIAFTVAKFCRANGRPKNTTLCPP